MIRAVFSHLNELKSCTPLFAIVLFHPRKQNPPDILITFFYTALVLRVPWSAANDSKIGPKQFECVYNLIDEVSSWNYLKNSIITAIMYTNWQNWYHCPTGGPLGPRTCKKCRVNCTQLLYLVYSSKALKHWTLSGGPDNLKYASFSVGRSLHINKVRLSTGICFFEQ